MKKEHNELRDIAKKKYPFDNKNSDIVSYLKNAHRGLQINAFIEGYQTAIEDLNKWIDVEDEIPELDCNVILKIKDCGQVKSGYYLLSKNDKMYHFYDYYKPQHEFLLNDVTHWRYV